MYLKIVTNLLKNIMSLGGITMKFKSFEKRIQIKAYYSYCSSCYKSLDSNEKYLYDGLCRHCYYERWYF